MRRFAAVVVLVSSSVLAAGCIVPPGPGDPVDPVDPVECATERRTIETALEAARIESASMEYPATLEELVGVWLEPGSIDVDWTYSSTGDSYTLLGPC